MTMALVDIYNEISKEFKKAYKTYRANLFSRINERIQGSETTESVIGINSAGRVYAKVDIFDVDGNMTLEYPGENAYTHYKPGQFLPGEFNDLCVPYCKSEKIKIRVTPNIAEYIKRNLLNVKIGKSWAVDDEVHAYMYVNQTNSIMELVAIKFIKENFKPSDNSKTSTHIAEGRYELKVKLLKINIYPCAYNGATSIGVFLTECGNIVTGNPTFCTSDDLGKVFNIRATISNGKDGLNHYKRPHLIK